MYKTMNKKQLWYTATNINTCFDFIGPLPPTIHWIMAIDNYTLMLAWKEDFNSQQVSYKLVVFTTNLGFGFAYSLNQLSGVDFKQCHFLEKYFVLFFLSIVTTLLYVWFKIISLARQYKMLVFDKCCFESLIKIYMILSADTLLVASAFVMIDNTKVCN